MTDERLRSHERARALSGSEEAEAEYLAEALRAGRIAPARLALLARLGWAPAAAMVVGAGDASPDGLVSALRAAGLEACLRAALVLLRRLLPHVAPDLLATGRDEEFLDPTALDGLVCALEELARCPCDAHAAAVIDREHLAMGASSYLLDASTGREETGGDLASAEWSAGVLRALVAVVQGPGYLWPEWPVEGSGRTSFVCEVLAAARGRIPEAELVSALRQELLPWLLGRGNPSARP